MKEVDSRCIDFINSKNCRNIIARECEIIVCRCHNILELVFGWPFGYDSKLLWKITNDNKYIPFLKSDVYPFSDTHPFPLF